jgi:hypothetical protein
MTDAMTVPPLQTPPAEKLPAGSKKVVGLIGLFDDPDSLIRAAETVRDAGYTKWDCHTPYPVHGLDDAMGLKPSPMPYITLGAGAVGAGAAMLMQWWMSAVDYPVRIGGKPLFSWPAFIPITFELFVLFAALATMGGMLALCKLGRYHSPLHDSGVMAEVTSYRHGVVLSNDDPKYDEAAAKELFAGLGCKDVRTLFEIVEEEA